MKDEFEAQRKEFLRKISEHVDTPQDRRERAIEALGTRWIMHKSNAPQKGRYNPLTGAKLS